MPAHDLHDEGPLVGGGGWDDGVDGLDDPVEGRVGPDGHVGPAEVVVDRAHHAHDVEVGVVEDLLLCDLVSVSEFMQEIWASEISETSEISKTSEMSKTSDTSKMSKTSETGETSEIS